VPGKSTTTGHLIYKCGGIDKRTIEKFEKVWTHLSANAPRVFGCAQAACRCPLAFCPLRRVFPNRFFFLVGAMPRHPTAGRKSLPDAHIFHRSGLKLFRCRKPQSWARAPSSTPGCSTS
jgi:hypothetical protein